MSTDSRSSVVTRSPRGEVVLPPCETDPEILAGWNEDAAHYPGGCCDELFFPRSEGEVAAILLRGRACLPVGSQSSLTGGATPRGGSLISLARMNAVELGAGPTVGCGAGTILADLAELLRDHDRYYPPVPTFDGATIGGNLATNAAGAATFRHGTTRDWVQGLTVVMPWGEVLELERDRCRADADGQFQILSELRGEVIVSVPSVRQPDVAKNSCGYFGRPGMDLVDLFVGAEGTLGVITSVRMRTISPRPSWFVVLVSPKDDASAVAVTNDLRELAADENAVAVSAIEYMDRACVELLAEDAIAEREALALDERAGAYLLIQVELPSDYDATRAYDELASGLNTAGPLARVARVLSDHGLLDGALPALPGEDGRRSALFAVREAVPEGVNRRVARAKRESGSTISKSGGDVIVPFARLAEALFAYRHILDDARLQHATWGHISDGNVHPNIIARNEAEMADAQAAQKAIALEAIRLGGAPMAEHGVGRNPLKQALLASFQGPEGMVSMRAVREALDPDGVLAPGVLWPGPDFEEGRK
ncbi:MAG: D-lactate dehydrogenase (cytochrome) [Hyphomicrobiaceae bacterium]